MSEKNDNQEPNDVLDGMNSDGQQPPKDVKNEDDPIEKAVQERLSKMKANMDRMDKELKETLKQKAELEKKEKDARLKALEEEGKFKEAADLRIKDLEAKLELYQSENVKLNRDNVLANALTGLEFRNDRSREMAYRDIVEQLVQNENGVWVHKSGNSIRDFVDSYSKSDDNSFLFRVKMNSGTGTGTPNGTPSTDTSKKVSEMTTQEVLDLARKGKLGGFGY